VIALRRVLYLQALVWASLGLSLAMAPRFVLVTAFGQPPYLDYALARIAGIDGFVLALLMVLVAHHAEQAWWWSWAFVLLSGATGAASTLNALIGVPEGASSWPWWLSAVLSWGFVAGLLYGLARAGVQRPPV
jgi:hypothetical protein